MPNIMVGWAGRGKVAGCSNEAAQDTQGEMDLSAQSLGGCFF